MKRFIDTGLQAHALSPCTAARPLTAHSLLAMLVMLSTNCGPQAPSTYKRTVQHTWCKGKVCCHIIFNQD